MCVNYKLNEKRKEEVKNLQMKALRVANMTNGMNLTTNQLRENQTRIMELNEKVIFLSQKFQADCEDFCEYFNLDSMNCEHPGGSGEQSE